MAINTELFPLKNIHIALFFSSSANFKPLKLASSLDEKMQSLFDVEPMILPIPADAPAELPRISINKDGIGSIGVSFVRADLSLEQGEDSCLEDVLLNIRTFIDCIMESGAQVARVGFVHRFALPPDITTASLKERYIKENKFNDVNEMNMSWLRRWETSTLDEVLTVNRMVSVICDRANKLLIVDNNTIPECIYQLTPDLIFKFIKECGDQIDGDFERIVEWE